MQVTLVTIDHANVCVRSVPHQLSSPCDQKIMGSNPGIVSNSKISLDFGYPFEKQIFTYAAVYPAVMGS